MALRAPEFPTDSVSTVALAVIGVGYVLAATAPHVRNFRDANRAWREASTASRDAHARLLALQESMTKTQASVDGMTSIEASTAVAFLLSLRVEVETFVEDLDSAILAIETARTKMRALKKYRAIIIKSRPDFDDALASFEARTGDLDKMRASADNIRDGDLPADIDKMLEIATEAATHETLRLARELAKTKPRPTAREALRSLEEIHEYAGAHGIKLNG